MEEKRTGAVAVEIVSRGHRDIGGALDALRAIPTTIIGDQLGRRSVLDPTLRPISLPGRFAGPALTVECAAGDISAALYAVERARPGDVVMIDARGYAGTAIWGEIMQTSAIAAGLAGVVVDGAVRDTAHIAASGLALFARGISARGPLLAMDGTVGRTISCGGCTIAPGDIVVGDEDGIAFIRPDELPGLVERCLARIHTETQIIAGIAEGRSARIAFGLADISG